MLETITDIKNNRAPKALGARHGAGAGGPTAGNGKSTPGKARPSPAAGKSALAASVGTFPVRLHKWLAKVSCL